ncbi:MAG: GtrA family protein [Bacteroidales bacterium]
MALEQYMQLLNIIFSDKLNRFVKYFIVGGVAAIINLIVFFTLAKILQFNYFIVGAIAFVIATFVNYSLSIKYVFESGARFGKNKELLLIYAASIIGLIGNEIILFILINLLHIEIMISQIIAIGVVFAWNYTARNSFVFKKL